MQITRIMSRSVLLLSILIPILSFTVSASSELILTAPPRESVEAGELVYGPLAKHLSIVLGQKVTYQHPKTWMAYQNKMRSKKYDIVFDGPHFAAWRISKGMAEPFIKLPGHLTFVLVTKANDTSVAQPSNLVGKRVCGLPSPNLATLSLFAMFPNPVQQPQFHFIRKGGMKKVAKQFLAGKCQGAILRKAFYLKSLKPEQRAKMQVIAESKDMTNQGFTISNKLSPLNKQQIIYSFKNESGKQALKPIIERFAKGKKFIIASNKDYANQNLLRDNMIFGW